jgi:predicted RNA-binding Zn-ribbon protein involved in translation (DUF1610 family)
MTDDRRIEPRAVDYVRTVTCPGCGREVETPHEEPWIIAGDQQHAPMLVAFVCPVCGQQIELDEPGDP